MEDELRQIRKQMASACLAFKEMGQQFRTGIDPAAREMEERFNQVEGRARLQEQRFGQMLVAVEGAVDDWKPEMEEVKARLERLEDRINSAA